MGSVLVADAHGVVGQEFGDDDVGENIRVQGIGPTASRKGVGLGIGNAMVCHPSHLHRANGGLREKERIVIGVIGQDGAGWNPIDEQVGRVHPRDRFTKSHVDLGQFQQVPARSGVNLSQRWRGALRRRGPRPGERCGEGQEPYFFKAWEFHNSYRNRLVL